MKANWVIVGAGFTGCTLAERIASQLDQKVLLIDLRDHVGGNAYDYYNEHAILIHKYGPHLFHTNSQKVWAYLSQFTEWHPYEHHVLGVVEGQKVPIPFNLNSLDALFPREYAHQMTSRLLNEFSFGTKIPILKLREHADPEIRRLAEYIYEHIFRNYTVKQWDLTPEELDPSVTDRVPVHLSRDNRYFQDAYQAMPKEGYARLFRRMLSHPNISVLLNTAYRSIAREVRHKRLIYTGRIDEFFDHVYGELPYRSLQFEFPTLDVDWYQEVGTVNYPNERDFTRISEPKHFSNLDIPKTTLILEYPQPHVRGQNDPYYPIPREDNRNQYRLYLREAKKLKGSVVFAGRLGDYRYYNMDQAVARALTLFQECVAS